MRIEVCRGLDAVKSDHKATALRCYVSVCSGTDPQAGKPIHCDCAGYRMNAGKDASMAMDAGVRLHEQIAAETMKVRDFHNNDHVVSLDVAKQIRNLQAADAHNHWLQKCAMVDAINAATTVEEVQAVDLTFSVNTE